MTRASAFPFLFLLILFSISSCTTEKQEFVGGSEGALSDLDRKMEPFDHLFAQRAYPEMTFDEQSYARTLKEAREDAKLSRQQVPGEWTAWVARGLNINPVHRQLQQWN